MHVKLKLYSEHAKVLSQREGDVGFDLVAAERTVLPPNRVTKIRTGIGIADWNHKLWLSSMPFGVTKPSVFPKIEGRSSLAAMGIFPVGNIIDPIYRGEVCVTMANLSGDEFVFEAGDRCAQFVFYVCMAAPDITFEETDEIVPTERGSKGFGSTGR